MSHMPARSLRIAVLLCLCAGMKLAALGQSPPAGTESGEIPPLSVETLYHPEQRFAYAPSKIPATRWTTDAGGSPLLLIKRPDGWMQLDPTALDRTLGQTTEPLETPWPGFKRLVDQLVSLGDVDAEAAQAAVSAWIGSEARSLDRALIRIGNALVLAGLEQTPRWVTRQAGSWMDPTLSPDGTRVAFVQQNDLFVMHLPSDRLTRITDDGTATRLNGRLDWVYQEELYGRGNFRAFWWADDSRSLALLRLDNAQVHPYTITTSATVRGGTLVDRYPKAGDPVTAAELWVTRLQDDPDSAFTLKPVFAPPAEKECLIVRVGWRGGSGELVFEVTNRLQNELTLWRYDPDAAGQPKPAAILHQSCDQWLEVLGLPHWLPDGDFLWLSDLPSGRRRLWRIGGDGSSRVPLTPAGFDVRELAAVDPEQGVAFVAGDLQRGTVGQQLYRVDLHRADGDLDPSLTRLTDAWPWHQVTLSPDHAWMVDRASGLSQPTVISLGRVVERAEKPAGAADRAWILHAEQVQLPMTPVEPQWLTVNTADGIRLPAYLFPPRGRGDSASDDSGDQDSDSSDDQDSDSSDDQDSDSSDDQDSTGDQTRPPASRFPVLIEIYGGPLAPTVRDHWAPSRYLFHQLLADQGIAVMVVDNRSSGGRGLADAWTIHRRVGEVETQDTLAAVAWLKSQAWVNPDRIALRGWSFGGFLTLHAMTHSDAFAAGVAGGSVSDWRNYDAIYTERYMGLPADNPSGYDATSPHQAAEQLSGRLLMIHGELDDNVHLANTLQMAAALQQAGKPFDLMIYPAAAHAVHAAMPMYHLMRTTVDFLRRELLDK